MSDNLKPVYAVFVRYSGGAYGYQSRSSNGLTQTHPKLFAKRGDAELAADWGPHRSARCEVVEFRLVRVPPQGEERGA